jgi:hypothetical protein
MKIDDEFSAWQQEWREQDSRIPEVRLPPASLNTVSFLKRRILNLMPALRGKRRKKKGEGNGYA